MALTVVRNTTASSGTSNVSSLTFSFPTTPATNNLLLLFLNTSDYSTNREPSAPDASWTQIQTRTNSTNQLTVWWKIFQSGDTNSFTFTISGTVEKCSGVMYEISGHNVASPIHTSSSQTNSNSTSMTTPSVTPSILGTMVFAGMATNDTETCSAVSSGWTLDATVKPSYHASYGAHRNSVTSDTTTAISNTFTTSAITDMPCTAIVFVTPDSSSIALSGSVASTSSITATLTNTDNTADLGGSVASTSSITAALTVLDNHVNLSGTVVAASSITATLAVLTLTIIDQLITDRSQSDITSFTALLNTINTNGWETLTSEEKVLWNTHRARHKHTDFNRIGEAVNYLVGILNSYGYNIVLSEKTDWATTDEPMYADLEELLDDIKTLKEYFYGTTALPSSIDNLTYTDANNIESLLVEIDLNISNMISSFRKCGTFKSGQGVILP